MPCKSGAKIKLKITKPAWKISPKCSIRGLRVGKHGILSSRKVTLKTNNPATSYQIPLFSAFTPALQLPPSSLPAPLCCRSLLPPCRRQRAKSWWCSAISIPYSDFLAVTGSKDAGYFQTWDVWCFYKAEQSARLFHGYSRLFLSNTNHSPAFAISSQTTLLTETTYCLSSLSGDPVLGHSFIPAVILLQDPACLLLPKQEAPASFAGTSPNLQHAVKTTLEKHLSLLNWIYKCEFQSASISEFNKNSLQNSHSQPKKCLLPSTPYPLINPWLEATPNLRQHSILYPSSLQLKPDCTSQSGAKCPFWLRNGHPREGAQPIGYFYGRRCGSREGQGTNPYKVPPEVRFNHHKIADCFKNCTIV